MTVRTLRARTACDGASLFQQLHRQAEFPAFAPDIISVTPSGHNRSIWKLAFRGGTVGWTQKDDVRADRMHIAFEQTKGDFIELGGVWSVIPETRGCQVSYDVSFRTSVAHLAGAVDPVVGRVLLRSATAVLKAIAGPLEILAGEEFLHDLPSTSRTT